MSEYPDLDELRDRVYFRAASLDDRYVWREIFPVEDIAANLLRVNPGLTDHQIEELGKVGIIYGPHTEPRWADGFERFMLVRCAHREVDRIAGGKQCGHCGQENPYEPAAAEAARKSPHTRWETKGSRRKK